MQKKTLIIGSAVLVGVLVLGGGGIALGASDVFDNDDDRNTSFPQSGSDNNRDNRVDASTVSAPSPAEIADASAAALDATGDGTVTEVERSDDHDHAWDVEITFADGRDVDVELTDAFGLVRIDD